MKYNILIAEPSALVANGITSMLTRINEHIFISHADSLSAISTLLNKGSYSLVIVNPMLIQNKLDIFKSLKKNFEGIVWISLVYSWYDANLLSLFDNAIHINDSGEQIKSILEKAFSSLNNPHSTAQQSLTEREIEVLKLLVEGNSNKEIAEKLSLSAHTVITHRKNITVKSGIKSVSGLTIYAVVKNIISLPQD